MKQIPKLALNGRPGNQVLSLVTYDKLHKFGGGLASCTVQRSSGCWNIPLAPKDALNYGAGVRENSEGKSALEQ